MHNSNTKKEINYDFSTLKKFFTLYKNSMIRFSLLISFCLIAIVLFGQSSNSYLVSNTIPKADKPRAVKYNGFGMGVFPADQLMIGSNHVSYRKYGLGMSFRLGLRNLLEPGEALGVVNVDSAFKNGWVTNKIKTYSYSVSLGFVLPITKKIPFYVGVGVARQKEYVKIEAPYMPAAKPFEWNVNAEEVKFMPTFNCGIFVPVSGRFVLNVGYDHLPARTLFLGFTISDIFNYEDIDLW